MARALAITVRLHDGRYHGMGEWAPSPARLFQALVAGAARGATLEDDARAALVWLEAQPPPTVALPRMWVGQRMAIFAPNNDLDAVGNDPARIAEIRTQKVIEPRLFDCRDPFLYAWDVSELGQDTQHARAVCRVADRVYQFGRGVDMAWAQAEIISREELDGRLARHPGPVHRPAPGSTGRALACPAPGSLASLSVRYAKARERFREESPGDPGKQLFIQPPKPHFVQVGYDSPPWRQAFSLRCGDTDTFFAYAQARASELVSWVREEAARRLREALPARVSDIEQSLVGRKADGQDDGPTSARIRILPLPSIGHEHVDRGIRRVLVEVPSGCLLRPGDVRWAVSGIQRSVAATGEVQFVVTPADDDEMLPRYLARGRVWRTVTPAALPERARRRRIDPARPLEEAKGGAERIEEQQRAAGAVVQALRHAGVRTRAVTIRAQREPFEARGERVEAFAAGTRFDKFRLWHVEIAFDQPIEGPLAIGDGRFLGLGVMRPVRFEPGIYAFAVEDGLDDRAQPLEIARAARRAVMARAQAILGERAALPAFFSGHESSGAPARRPSRSHLTFTYDPLERRVLVVAPHVVENRLPTRGESRNIEILEAALLDFHELRAGHAGRLTLSSKAFDIDTDRLTTPSRTWESATPYVVTRHAKRVGANEALSADVQTECRRRGLPEPAVTTFESHGAPGLGLVGRVRLEFAVAQRGPILLGKTRYAGGGLFSSVR